MKTRPGQKIKMLTVDEILGVPVGESAVEIDVEKIYAFENHPFKVHVDDKMHELVESVLENGILTPVIVRPDDEDGYEMIKVQTPVLLTAIAELNHPRDMNVGKIFATKDKEITVFTANDLDVDASQIGLKVSPTKVQKSMTKEAKGAGEVVKESAPEAVSYVLGKLKEKHYI